MNLYDRIPNNVNLSEDKRLQRALEKWLPNFLAWWHDMGPEGFQQKDVWLRTAVDVGSEGWAHFDYVKMPDYRWGIFLEPAEPDVAYLTIRKPEPGEDIRILQTWECPNCNRVDNWAEIVIQGGIIRSIQPVSLNRETFRRANFIEGSAASVASRLLDIPINETIGMDVVQVLRERL